MKTTTHTIRYRGTHTVRYRGFLQDVTRTFPTHERAEQWLRQIGRADLIPSIKEVRTDTRADT